MYGTLAGALAGRKIPFDRTSFTATVDGRIVGVGRTIKIESIAMHYRVSVPAERYRGEQRVHHTRGLTRPARRHRVRVAAPPGDSALGDSFDAAAVSKEQ